MGGSRAGNSGRREEVRPDLEAELGEEDGELWEESYGLMGVDVSVADYSTVSSTAVAIVLALVTVRLK
jgi:hypothetical protein